MKSYKENLLEPGMYPMCKSVQQMILDHEDIYKSIENIIPWLEHWTGVFLHNVYHHFKDVRSFNSILFCALQSQTMQLDWIRFSFCSGQYDSALRELRNTIESSFLFHKYDHKNEFSSLSVLEKYQHIKKDMKNNKNRFSKKIFEESGYANWEDAYENIYKPLCMYIHTGSAIERAINIEKDGLNSTLQPYFCEEEIIKCIDYFKMVIHTEIKLMESVLKDTYDIETEHFSIFE